MKFLLASLLISQAVAFAPIAQGSVNTALRAGAYEPMDGEGKLNLKIDLDNPKVVNMESLAAGEKKVYCRCWLSGTFPLCDGTHAKHNDAIGDNVGPLIVSGPKKE